MQNTFCINSKKGKFSDYFWEFLYYIYLEMPVCVFYYHPLIHAPVG